MADDEIRPASVPAGRRAVVLGVTYDVGRLLGVVAAAMASLVVVALASGEAATVPGLAVALAITAGLCVAFVRVGRLNRQPSRAYGMVVAASGWLVVACVGALPFLAVAWTYRTGGAASFGPATAPFVHPVNALFESMSGFTGTGLTVAPAPAHLPRVLQWWRSLTEWIGGIGVIVLTAAVLSRPWSGSLTLYEGDARSKRLHFRALPRLRTIVGILAGFTVGSVALLLLAGLPPWAALNDAMTGLTTGGFTVTDGSIGAYHDPVVSLALVPVMTLGSIAFPVLYLALHGDYDALLGDVQVRWFVGLVVAGTLALTGVLALVRSTGTLGADAVAAVFQFVSALSCTGFSTVSIGGLPSTAKLVLILAMVVGGSAGSTVGGIKLVRLITLSYGSIHRIRGSFYPAHAVRPLRIGDRLLTPARAAVEIQEAAIVSFLWVVFLLGGIAVLQTVFLLQGTPHPLLDVVFDVASAQGNVGLSSGLTAASLPWIGKLTLVGNMWIGRLEIVPTIVFLRGIVAGLNATA